MNVRNGSRKATMEGNTTDQGTLCNNTISEGVTIVWQDVVATLKLQLSASVWKLSVVAVQSQVRRSLGRGCPHELNGDMVWVP